MGWLRLGGSLNSQVSFAKEPYKSDYILQKRPMILRRLLIVATPYIYRTTGDDFDVEILERHRISTYVYEYSYTLRGGGGGPQQSRC